LMAAYNAAVGKYFSGGAKDNAGLAADLLLHTKQDRLNSR